MSQTAVCDRIGGLGPSLLVMNSGREVKGVPEWEGVRRAEVSKAILPVEYGRMPARPSAVRVEEIGRRAPEKLPWFDGVNLRQLKVWTKMDDEDVTFVLRIWCPDGKVGRRWPLLLEGDGCWAFLTDDVIRDATSRGWMVAQFNRCEVARDDKSSRDSTLLKWAWTYHRAIDALLKAEPRVDSAHIAITGHSRGGKTVLLAGATDDRIFAVGENGSGCGGAGPCRDVPETAETIEKITHVFPHWFAPDWKTWAGRERSLPFDQHYLMALIAPRKLFVREGEDDLWCNPHGAARTVEAAREVWALYGRESDLVYSLRKGGHNHSREDFAAFLSFIGDLRGEFVVAERGKAAECTIAHAKDADPCVRYAAEELRDYVKRVTGVELTINGKAKRKIRLEAERSRCGMPDDSYAIVSGDDGLRVRGKSARGCLYGVYDLLERFGGVGFYTSWCEKVPRLDRFAVPQCSVRESPAFAMRQSFWHDVAVHHEFAAKLRLNGFNHTSKAVPTKLGGHDFRFGGGLGSCHTFNILCDPNVYFDSHPEYFSLVKGKRQKDSTQLCLTNPDVLEIVVSNVLARIRKDPGAKFYGVSQNDWHNFCECEKCKAIDDEEESHAGTMVRFVNAVAERVEREFPDVLIETLAYRYTRKPPKKAKLRHNVVPCLCTIECDFARPIPESPCEHNKSFMKDIVGWANQSDMLYLWDYVTQFRHYPQAFPNVYALQGNIRFFRDHGVKMLFEQGDYQGYHGGFAELKAWLLAKWMWNPEAEMKPLLDDFFAGYYGDAAPFVREYFEEIHRRQLAVSSDPKRPLTLYMCTNTEPYNNAEFSDWAEGVWQKAEAAVKGDAPFEYNVRMGHFSHLYSRLQVMRETKGDDELRKDPEAVALARRLLKDKSEARGPLVLGECGRDAGYLAGWRKIAGE